MGGGVWGRGRGHGTVQSWLPLGPRGREPQAARGASAAPRPRPTLQWHGFCHVLNSTHAAIGREPEVATRWGGGLGGAAARRGGGAARCRPGPVWRTGSGGAEQRGFDRASASREVRWARRGEGEKRARRRASPNRMTRGSRSGGRGWRASAPASRSRRSACGPFLDCRTSRPSPHPIPPPPTHPPTHGRRRPAMICASRLSARPFGARRAGVAPRAPSRSVRLGVVEKARPEAAPGRDDAAELARLEGVDAFKELKELSAKQSVNRPQKARPGGPRAPRRIWGPPERGRPGAPRPPDWGADRRARCAGRNTAGPGARAAAAGARRRPAARAAQRVRAGDTRADPFAAAPLARAAPPP
jgi:hypothetical protein